MKSKAPIISTIRFRRWSRKSYAAFACIGRCVTIGCLRKNVIDSSLAKQKTTGAATHVRCRMGSVWKGITKGKEDDYSTLPEIESLLCCGIQEQIMALNALSGTQDISFIKREGIFPHSSNYISTIYPNLYDLCRSLYSDKSCFLLNRAGYRHN